LFFFFFTWLGCPSLTHSLTYILTVLPTHVPPSSPTSFIFLKKKQNKNSFRDDL
jgi:hypothetical protein